MSFLKIKDPSKRDKLVAEYIKTKNKIQNDFRSERLDEQSMYEDFGKIFKPITEQQRKSSKKIVSKFTPVQEAIENMPAQQALPWDMPQPEALPDAAAVAPAKHTLPINIGRIADKYLRASHGKSGGHSYYGLKDKNGQFYIGKDLIEIDGNDLVLKGKRYRGTQGLWQLIRMKQPEPGFPTKEDVKNYGEIMVEADAIRYPDNPDRPFKSKSSKWNNFIKPIWDEYEKKTKQKANGQKKKTQGKGFLPSDPNALCERLELLMVSKQAGNTGLRNEIASICDELLRQKILCRDAYKN